MFARAGGQERDGDEGKFSGGLLKHASLRFSDP
jgi:hypothetical protein